MAHQYFLTLSVAVTIIVVFILLGILVWAWGLFLDKYEHDPGRVRAVMFLVLSVITATEIGFAMDGFILPWVAWVSVAVNLWGPLDALLRYPAAHELESFFAVKQFALLVGKTFAFAFGVISLKTNIIKFMVELNIWGLPVIYLMALPLDPAEQLLKDDSYDVDLAVRVWQLAMCSRERRVCIATCRTWWHKNLVAASECSQLARFAICAASPEYRRTFKAKGRCV